MNVNKVLARDCARQNAQPFGLADIRLRVGTGEARRRDVPEFQEWASSRGSWPLSYRRMIVTLTLMRKVTIIRGKRARCCNITSSMERRSGQSRPAFPFLDHDG
jgi:hypothetical protein